MNSLDRIYNMPQSVQEKYLSYGVKGLEKISQQLNNPEISECKKKILTKIAYAIIDFEHCDPEKRAYDVKKYIDKWDREHPADKIRA